MRRVLSTPRLAGWDSVGEIPNPMLGLAITLSSLPQIVVWSHSRRMSGRRCAVCSNTLVYRYARAHK